MSIYTDQIHRALDISGDLREEGGFDLSCPEQMTTPALVALVLELVWQNNHYIGKLDSLADEVSRLRAAIEEMGDDY